jgi:DNA-binding response OmpR family regulator
MRSNGALPESAMAQPRWSNGKKKVVLIIEDGKGVEEIIRVKLEEEGFAVAVADATASRAAARSARQRLTDAIPALTDVPPARNVYEKGRLRIDFDAYEVLVDGRKVHVFLREFELLRFLVHAPNRVFSREQILRELWRRDDHVEPRTVDVHMRRLRTRIERNADHPEVIVTVRGVGYKFNDRALESAAERASAVPANAAGSWVATSAATSNPAPSRAAKTSSRRRPPR